VFEREPFLAPELQRRFRNADVAVRSCRLASEVNAAKGVRVVVLDMEAAPEEVLRELARLSTRDDAPAAIVIASAALQEAEWAVRELGAAGFLDGFVGGERLARQCGRLLALRHSTTCSTLHSG
jgi:DNA-binding NtrC family response regulator